MGHFCPPGSGSGFRIRIRIHWPDLIRILYGSGSETLGRSAIKRRFLCDFTLNPSSQLRKPQQQFQNPTFFLNLSEACIQQKAKLPIIADPNRGTSDQQRGSEHHFTIKDTWAWWPDPSDARYPRRWACAGFPQTSCNWAGCGPLKYGQNATKT